MTKLSIFVSQIIDTFRGTSSNCIIPKPKHEKDDSDILHPTTGAQPPISTAETIGLVTTAALLTVGATIAEFTLLILGLAMLEAGPLGVVADLAFIVPAELLILDVEIGVDKYIYDVVTSGTREGHKPEFILIPVIKDLIGN